MGITTNAAGSRKATQPATHPAPTARGETAALLTTTGVGYSHRVWAHGAWSVDGTMYHALEPVPFTEEELRRFNNGQLPPCIEPIS